MGRLVDEHNKKYTDIMRNKFPKTIQRWENRPGMVIVRVRPTFVVTGGSSNDHVYINFLDLEKETAYAERWAHY